ncbi:peptidase M28 family protein [bacterium]|nr:MAG: peptidase M28 family protein [bacterium]
MNRKSLKIPFLICFFLITQCLIPAFGQVSDSAVVRNIYSAALLNDAAYNNLKYLCKNIGGRIAGSPESLKAVEWGKRILEEIGLDNVYLQETKVRNWIRGEKETGRIYSGKSGNKDIWVSALGTSVGTGINGIKAKVVEVKSLDTLRILGETNISGKIVFFNRPTDQRNINTGSAYGGAADQRVRGAIEASKFGAVGVIIRSLSTAFDEYPHTGIMRYADTIKKIPAFSTGTSNADLLSRMIKDDSNIELFLKSECKENDEVKSYNVVAEIMGTEFPEEIILIGGHLDAWDTCEGAHDDGTGVIHCYEVLRLFKQLGIKPRHTIRAVFFMDEEIAQRGARTYAETVKAKNEKHIAAIESDAGGFLPLGFSCEISDDKLMKMQQWKSLLQPYGIFFIEKGWSGVDISFLKEQDFPLMELVTNSQRYFDYHHSPADVFETVNRRELQLGSASIASLVYLIDKYGL